MEKQMIMKALLGEKMKWEAELGITDPSDPYSSRCREAIAGIELKIAVEEATNKKSSKKSSKKSK